MIKHTTAALAALTAGFGIASAQDMGGVKLGIHAGGSWVITSDASSAPVAPATVRTSRDFEFDGGAAIGATAAFDVSESLMVEAEYTFRNNEFSEGATDDDFNTSAFMVNALLPMDVDSQTTGYLGAGVGYIMKHDSDRSVPVVDELDGAFAWQIKGGFDYDIGGKTLGFGLTYLSAEFEGDDETEVEFGTLMGTVALKFGG